MTFELDRSAILQDAFNIVHAAPYIEIKSKKGHVKHYFFEFERDDDPVSVSVQLDAGGGLNHWAETVTLPMTNTLNDAVLTAIAARIRMLTNTSK